MSASSPLHILFSVAGLTPAVVTETLYGLLQQKGVRGGEIHLLTTTKGQENMQVLLGERGKVARFNADWGTEWVIRDEWVEAVRGRDAYVPNATPESLDDLRNRRDNAAAADAVTERVRRFTGRDEVVLHASAAGGRKTLGLFVAQAMSWFARPGDTLSHVLVPPEYELRDRKFFYPIPGSEDEEGIVDFAELGFVRMRGLLPESFLSDGNDGAPRSYSELVRLSQVFLRDTLNRSGNLVLCRSKRFLEVDRALTLHLQPVSGALYEFLFLHANAAREQEIFRFREAFTYREALAECLESWQVDQDVP